RRYLKVSITSIIGNKCTFPDDLTAVLNTMLEASEERFYLSHSSIARLHEARFSTNYPLDAMNMNEEVKRLIIREDLAGLQDWAQHWEALITAHRYRPDVVKSWVLSLLLDMEKMLQSLQSFESNFIDSAIHRSIVQAKTVKQLVQHVLDC